MRIRWVLVRDPKNRVRPMALLCTDVDLPAAQIVGHFVRRWAMETTFQETRVYFGIEGQRQWNDLAVARSTPPASGALLPGHVDGPSAVRLASLRAAGRLVQKGAANLLGCAWPPDNTSASNAWPRWQR